jgi:hypothetical protein
MNVHGPVFLHHAVVTRLYKSVSILLSERLITIHKEFLKGFLKMTFPRR